MPNRASHARYPPPKRRKSCRQHGSALETIPLVKLWFYRPEMVVDVGSAVSQRLLCDFAAGLA
jgi:hypothetical protein